ncbi:hypothetical protein RvY_06978 [Ramazzottius varieornatus]|uniref:F-box domain-containing protein n=1 Tax=Ramazzottius varieornatus TaxID=947166 RepID=A0A1D1V3R4_RAMVA|nr:hypothetical protein RvY_06978 [Ramazzottius varieornatus]
MAERSHAGEPTFGINQLPYEVLIAIFAHLDCSTRYRVRRVCGFWNSLLSFEFPIMNVQFPHRTTPGQAFESLVDQHQSALASFTTSSSAGIGDMTSKPPLTAVRSIVISSVSANNLQNLLDNRVVAFLLISFRKLRDIVFVGGKVNFWLLMDLPLGMMEIHFKNVTLDHISSIDYLRERQTEELPLSFELMLKKALVKLVDINVPVYPAGQKQLIGLDIKKLPRVTQQPILRIIRQQEKNLSTINVSDVQDIDFGLFRNSTLRELELYIPKSYDSYSHWQNLDRFSSSKLFRT